MNEKYEAKSDRIFGGLVVSISTGLVLLFFALSGCTSEPQVIIETVEVVITATDEPTEKPPPTKTAVPPTPTSPPVVEKAVCIDMDEVEFLNHFIDYGPWIPADNIWMHDLKNGLTVIYTENPEGDSPLFGYSIDALYTVQHNTSTEIGGDIADYQRLCGLDMNEIQESMEKCMTSVMDDEICGYSGKDTTHVYTYSPDDERMTILIARNE